MAFDSGKRGETNVFQGNCDTDSHEDIFTDVGLGTKPHASKEDY